MEIGLIAGSIFTGYGWTGYAVRELGSLAIPMSMLMFTRAEERQADFYGLQYMYKAGYDPTAFVDFFEKLETMEKTKPGAIAKVFATHPMNEDRIKAAQREMATFPTRPEYVVDTSEFEAVKARLAMLHNRRKTDHEDPNRPRLRRAPGSGTGPVDDGNGTDTDTDDGRPTLKRRDSGGGQ